MDFYWGHGGGGSSTRGEMKENFQPAWCGVMGRVRELEATVETGAHVIVCWIVEDAGWIRSSFDLDLGKTDQVLCRLRVFWGLEHEST